MTKHRTKTKKRLRFCGVRLSADCEPIYEASKKTSRLFSCDYCKQHLWSHGTNIEGYIIMKQELTESIEWKDRQNATMTVKTQRPLEVNGKQKGTTGTVMTMDVTIDDIEKGRMVLLDRIAKTNKKIETFENQQIELGKIPVRTSEMIRLEKNILAISIIKQNQKLINDINPLKEEVLEIQHNLKEREKCLNTRPKE